MVTSTIWKILFTYHILKTETNVTETTCDIFIDRVFWREDHCFAFEEIHKFERGYSDDPCRIMIMDDDSKLSEGIHCVILQGENTGTVEGNVRQCNGSELPEANYLSFPIITFLFKNCPIKPRVFYMYDFLPFHGVIFFGKTETSVLRNDSFYGICSVKGIVLHDNKIKSIESAAFSCITKYFVYLDLSKNLIQILPEGLFRSMSDLRILHLSQNHLKFLTVRTFSRLASLELLRLNHNHLKYISHLPFRNLRSLKMLYLSYNPGLILDDYLFIELYNLFYLNLDNCNISFLPNRIFGVLYNLIFLSLKKNQLKSMNRFHFEDSRKIKYLYLSQNLIQEVAGLQLLSDLKYLNISHNLLTSLPGTEYNFYLKILDISHNNFTDIRDIKVQYVFFLWANNNYIEQLFIPEVHRYLYMHLEENKIRFIYISAGNLEENPGYEASLLLYLSGNPLQCDCNAYEIFSMIKDKKSEKYIYFKDSLTCQYPERFSKMELNALNYSDFECSSCPVRCQCEYHVYNYIENKVNCSDRNYEEFPVVTSQNASVLDVSQNRLKSLAGLNQSCWENLIELNAEDNKIKSDEFYIPDSLAFLGLKGNEMSSLPIAVKEHAEKKNDFKMTLSRNMWPCNCFVIPFQQFISNHSSQIIDISEIRCIFPNKSTSRDALLFMNYSDLCPNELRYFTIISSTVAVIFMTVTIVMAVYYRNKTYLHSFMYTHCNGLYMMICCNSLNVEEKVFDCFISYSSKDSDVAFTIVEELENKPPTYKFCVHERNWIAGEYITKNILVSVQNSRKTLIILTKEFVKSPWFHLEFQAAFSQSLQDKQNRLIFVLKGELPDKNEMEKDLLHVLSTVTYLKWGDRWFWEKQRYALHESKSFVKQKPKNGWSRLKILFRKDDTSKNTDLELSVAVNNESTL